jgi:hypothetical protein
MLSSCFEGMEDHHLKKVMTRYPFLLSLNAALVATMGLNFNLHWRVRCLKLHY